MSSPNFEGILLLEQPFSKTTSDQLKRQLRFQQRLIEREIGYCNSTIKNLKSTYSSNSTGVLADRKRKGDVKEKDKEDEEDEQPEDESQILIDISLDESTDLLRQQKNLDTGKDVDSKNSELERGLDGMIDKLRGLKRKLAPLPQTLTSTLQSSRSRYSHLQDLHEITSTSSTQFQEWSQIRLDRFIGDWMLRKGFQESARLIGIEQPNSQNLPGSSSTSGFGSATTLNKNATKNRGIRADKEEVRPKGITDLLDLELFKELNQIEDSLVIASNNPGLKGKFKEGMKVQGKNSCTPALNWCSENKSSLKKVKDSTIEFDLRLQEYIELARIRTPESLKEAILYARRYLLPLYSSTTTASIPPIKPLETPSKPIPKKSRDVGETSIGRRALLNSTIQAQAQSIFPSTSISTPTTATANGNGKEIGTEALTESQALIRSQISRAMGLLASGPEHYSYQDLYNKDRWLILKENFRKVFFELHGLPEMSVLQIALSAGLSSLKVRGCYEKIEEKRKFERDESLGSSQEGMNENNQGTEVNLVVNLRGQEGTRVTDTSTPVLSMVTERTRNSDRETGEMVSSSNIRPSWDMNIWEANESSNQEIEAINPGVENIEVEQSQEIETSTSERISTTLDPQITNSETPATHGEPNSIGNSLNTLGNNTNTFNLDLNLQAAIESSSNVTRTSDSYPTGSKPLWTSKDLSKNSSPPSKKKKNSSKSTDCPICDSKGLGLLAKEVPWSHHSNSTLVCWISGKLMNEEDPPLSLPNGRCYSRTALEEMARKSPNGSTVTCPRTGDKFAFSEVRKVYIS